MDGVALSESKAHLLGYVRSLRHTRCRGGIIEYQMRDLAQDSGGYFSGLHNLHSLTFYNIRVEDISEGEFRTCFSGFRETLKYLSLGIFTTSFSALVTLIGYFPKITTLRLSPFVLRPDEGPVPSFPQPLRGKLHVHEVEANCLEFFRRFAKLDLGYDELVIGSSSPIARTKFVENALQISPRTVELLRLATELECK